MTRKNETSVDDASMGATGGPRATPAGLAELEARFQRARRWNIILVVIVVFLVIVATAQVLPGNSPTTSPGTAEPTAGESSDTAGSAQPDSGYEELEFVRRDPADPMAIGSVDAPVVMTMWTDLRCPFCAVFSRDTLPALVEQYVEAGQVRIEFSDVAFFGEQSEDAAVAAIAAGNQGLYMEFATAIYDEAPERGHPDLPRERLLEYAEKAGVPDMERFVADLDDPGVRAQAQQDTISAQQLGVNSVPFFVAGNTALSGAQPVQAFQGFLDQALSQAN